MHDKFYLIHKMNNPKGLVVLQRACFLSLISTRGMPSPAIRALCTTKTTLQLVDSSDSNNWCSSVMWSNHWPEWKHQQHLILNTVLCTVTTNQLEFKCKLYFLLAWPPLLYILLYIYIYIYIYIYTHIYTHTHYHCNVFQNHLVSAVVE